MSVNRPGLFWIMQRFPSAKDPLRRLYMRNQSFQTLCDDYQKCTQALEYWRCSGQKQAPERSLEYKELRQELEVEIIGHIDAMR